jgi:hypothetical protein
MTFKELPTGSYFYFTPYQIRRKVSIKKYIWILDYDRKFCMKESDEEAAPRWKPRRPALSQVIPINFKYD